MLSTVLATYPWLAKIAVLVIIVVAPFLAWWLIPRRRLTFALAAFSAVVVAILTLYPDGRPGLETCILAVRPAELLAVEPLANVVLFIPLSLFLATATRSPLLGFGAGIALTTIIEALQLLVPAIGRSCTAMDWIANAVGAALGAGLAAIGTILARRRTTSGS